MKTLRAFIRENRITSTARWADANPNMDDDDSRSMTHYRVILRRAGRQLTVPFSMGMAYASEPTAEDVLDCLASDASGLDNGDFEVWAAEYGYDTDSRRAERIFNAVKAQTAKLRAFLDDEPLFRELLYETERL